MNANSANVGTYIVAKTGTAPAANGAATRNGTGIDRVALGVDSCVLVALIGAPTGSPTGFTYDLKLQDSANNTDWADFNPSGVGTGAMAQQTAAGVAEKDIDLTLARQYVRVVETLTITGGTAPTVPAGSAIVFGGASTLPL